MTIATDTSRAGPYAGAGTVGPFVVDFRFLEDAHLVVTRRDTSTLVETRLALNVDFTVSGAGSPFGGWVTLAAALAVGQELTIVRDVPITQLADYVESDSFPANSHEDALDKLTMIAQQLSQGVRRSIRVPETSADLQSLPSAVDRAGRLVGFDSLGNPIAVIPAPGDASGLALDLASSNAAVKGAGQLGYAWPLTYAQGTVGAKLREFVSVFDFMTAAQIADVQAGSLTEDVRAPIAAAFAASKRVYFPSGTYWLGAHNTSALLIDLTARGDNISVLTDTSVELVCESTAEVMPRFFYLQSNNNFHCGPIRFRDLGYDYTKSWKGAIGFTLVGTASAGIWGSVTLDHVYGEKLVAVVQVARSHASSYVRGIKIGQIVSNDCYYGFNAQDQGDGVEIGNLYAYRNYRPYFVYGVSGHRVKVFGRENRITSGAINIGRLVGGRDTADIDVTYTARDQISDFTHVLINHIDLLGGSISNVRVHVDIRSSVTYDPVRFVNYNGSAAESASASPNVVNDIQLSGSCDVQARAVSAVAGYGSIGRLTFTPGAYFRTANALRAQFRLSDASERNQAVTWAASVSPPSIGNGTLASDHDVVGGMCTFTVKLTIGSTTNLGNGIWYFTLPYAARGDAVGSARILDTGTAFLVGTANVGIGDISMTVTAHNTVDNVGHAIPIAWATGDVLLATITYPIAH